MKATHLKQYNLILIRYNEIWLKSTKIKIRMLKTLMNNIKIMLNRAKIPFNKYQLSRDSTRIFYFFNNKDILNAIEVLKKAFGIHSFSPALRTSSTIKNITEKTIEIGKEILEKGDTFALRVRRSGKHEFNSKYIANKVGQAVKEYFQNLNLKVNLSSPKKRIFIEIRSEFSYIYTDIIMNEWGGLPIEPQKKIMVMDVGRLNDLLAGFLLMRRGCEIYPVLFDLTSNEVQLKNRLANWAEVRNYAPRYKFVVIRIKLHDIISEVCKKLADKKDTCGICRLVRFDVLSRVLKTSNVKCFKKVRAISDGMSLNGLTPCSDDVDLESIALNHVFSEYPIFTPVIGLDLKKIEQYLFTISNYLKKGEYCPFKPKNQESGIEELRNVYESLNLDELILECLNNSEEINI